MFGLKFGKLGGADAPPASAPTDPYWANVKMLASFEGANGSTTFTDLTGSGTLTGSGGAAIDTTYNANGDLKLLGGSSSRVTSSKISTVGAGQFTWEAYVRPTSAVTGRIISAQNSLSPNAVIAYRTNSNGSITALMRNSSGSGLIVLTSASGLVDMTGTTEHHIAFTRDASNNVTLWLDGVNVATAVSATNPDASRVFYFGAFDNTQELFAGHIRWGRVTEGVCRYTATFTPPAIPYPTS